MKSFSFYCSLFLAPLAAWGSVADGSDLQEVLELNRRYGAATATGDGVALGRILHRNYIHTAHDGEVRDQAAHVAFIKARGPVLESGRSDDVKANSYGNVVVVTERFSATRTNGGKSTAFSERATLVWAKEAEGWRLVAEQRALPTSAPSVAPQPTVPTLPSQTPATSLAAAPATADSESRQRSGLLPAHVRQLFRAYEPNQVGYTWDEGDDSFLDFTFSLMFPLYGPAYPSPYRRTTGDGPFRELRYSSPGLYLAHTQRAGQYIGTRSSSPVVGKRFNPLLALRFWAKAPNGEKESEDNFFEVVYAHESNGQFVNSPMGFSDQLAVYFNESTNVGDPGGMAEARRSTRDNISRGWDYIGAQFARDWDANWVLPWDKASSSTLSLRAKLNYFLDRGVSQGDAEEYNDWEDDPEGKARKYVDGIPVRLTMTIGPKAKDPGDFGLERRYAFTWTTGYGDPLRYNTFKMEAGVMAFGFPLMLWYRTGYNSDLVDYYRRDHSYGATLSFWKY